MAIDHNEVRLAEACVQLRLKLKREHARNERERSRNAGVVQLAKILVADALGTLDDRDHQPPGVAAAHRRLRDLERVLSVTDLGAE